MQSARRSRIKSSLPCMYYTPAYACTTRQRTHGTWIHWLAGFPIKTQIKQRNGLCVEIQRVHTERLYFAAWWQQLIVIGCRQFTGSLTSWTAVYEQLRHKTALYGNRMCENVYYKIFYVHLEESRCSRTGCCSKNSSITCEQHTRRTCQINCRSRTTYIVKCAHMCMQLGTRMPIWVQRINHNQVYV